MNPLELVTRPLRRAIAQRQLDRVDAWLAHYYVADGQLADPDELSADSLDLRNARVRAVRRLEAAGGHDPFPTVFAPLTAAQQRHRDRLAERVAIAFELVDVLEPMLAAQGTATYSDGERVNLERLDPALVRRAERLLWRAREATS